MFDGLSTAVQVKPANKSFSFLSSSRLTPKPTLSPATPSLPSDFNSSGGNKFVSVLLLVADVILTSLGALLA